MISFSAYMLRSTKFNNFKMIPTLLMHGENDPVIK